MSEITRRDMLRQAGLTLGALAAGPLGGQFAEAAPEDRPSYVTCFYQFGPNAPFNLMVAAAIPQTTHPFAAALDSAIPKVLTKHGVPGCVIGVVEAGKTSCLRGYGLADCKTGRAMTPQTVISVASISKAISAWGILHLVDQKKLDLDAPIESRLKGWKLPHSQFNNRGVTVRRLLSHTAGLSMFSVPSFPADSPLPSLIDVLNGSAGDKGDVRLVREPGSAWSYSGGGYILLQMLVEEVTGQRFHDYMRAAILKPLRMRDSGYELRTKLAKRSASLYDEKERPIAPYRLVGEAAGTLETTMADFVRFLQAYAPKGNRRKLLSEETFHLMLSPAARVEFGDVKDAWYGLGHGVHRTAKGDVVVYHSGGNPGVKAYFLVSLTTGNGIAVFVNGENGAPVIIEVLQLWAKHYQTELPPLF